MSQESVETNVGPLTEAEQAELNLLERLQTSYPEPIDGEVWNPETHLPRISELRRKKEGGPSQEQRDRFNELSKLQTKGGPEWTPELQEEIRKLYPLFDRN